MSKINLQALVRTKWFYTARGEWPESDGVYEVEFLEHRTGATRWSAYQDNRWGVGIFQDGSRHIDEALTIGRADFPPHRWRGITEDEARRLGMTP